MAQVFVSHSHEDNEFCRRFVKALQARGLDVWYDENNLGEGVIRLTIDKELKSCEHFIVILSPAAVASQWVNMEIDAALDLSRRGRSISFLPVVAEPCDIPPTISGRMRVEGQDTAEGAADEAYEKIFLTPHHTTHAKPEVKVITDSADPDFAQAITLYTKLFPPDEIVAEEDMIRYIDEAQVQKAMDHPTYLEEFVIVKLENDVVAFMNYTFYYKSRFVFISYVGSKRLINMTGAVMGALFAWFRDRMLGIQCRGAVFEVEDKNFKRDDTRVNRKVEISRLRRFKQYLTKFAEVSDTDCYEVNFNFIQPYLLIEEVRDMPRPMRTMFDRMPGVSRVLGYDRILRLGYIPLTGNGKGMTKIKKADLLELLDFVYLEVYADSFIDDPVSDKQFKQYMRRLINYFSRVIPTSGVALS